MISEEEHTSLSEKFTNATLYIRSKASTINKDVLLTLYGSYKQANDGPCNTSKPGFFDFQGKQKWEAWKKLGDTSKDMAMQMYIEAVDSVNPSWCDEVSKSKDSAGGLGVSVSTMMNTEVALVDSEKNVFDWCKENEIGKVRDVLENGEMEVNLRDDEGLTLLHWSCDRGHVEMVVFLLEKNADVNIQDSDGQTPLHYAVCCGHSAVISALLSHGADRNIPDADGLTPEQTTDDSDILTLLNSNVT